jgi:prephenate dehydratase
VPRAYELLMEHDLRIQAEVIMRVQHTLMAMPGVNLNDLKRVRSTPISLQQCEKFIGRYGLEQIPASDTASSARDLAARPEPELGVIASKLAAQIYKLEILVEEVEDAAFNYTSLCSGQEGLPRAQRQNVADLVPAICRVRLPPLLEFAERNINLTKIESGPWRTAPGSIYFTSTSKVTGKTWRRKRRY